MQKGARGPGATAVRLTGLIYLDEPLPLSWVLLPLSAEGRQPRLDPGAGKRDYMAGSLPAGGSRPRLVGEGRGFLGSVDLWARFTASLLATP